jgi:glycosyltransferase involved in cell wall biosynthesis
LSVAHGAPLVSIGLPVYNEASHVDAALSALRAQDHAQLEIVVCDNCSTDNTLEICRRHAQQDARVRIVAADSNIGASANFLRAAQEASGEYFMWASGHDLWQPNFVSECVRLLAARPQAVLAHAEAIWIGPTDEILDHCSGWSDTRGMAPIARFFTILWGSMNPILGLIRLSALRECRPLQPIVGGDLVLLSDLALRGEFLHARNTHWCRRELRSETGFHQKVKRYVSPQFAVAKSSIARRFPLLSLPFALVGVVLRSGLSGVDKALVLLALPPSLLLRFVVGRRDRRA